MKEKLLAMLKNNIAAVENMTAEEVEYFVELTAGDEEFGFRAIDLTCYKNTLNGFPAIREAAAAIKSIDPSFKYCVSDVDSINQVFVSYSSEQLSKEEIADKFSNNVVKVIVRNETDRWSLVFAGREE